MNQKLTDLFAKRSQLNQEKEPRKYENWVVNEISKKITAEEVKEYAEYIKDLSNQTEDRFVCFFALFSYYRKNGFLKDMDNLAREYTDDFDEFFLFDHIKMMARVKLSTISQYDSIIKDCAIIINKYENFVGFLNQFVEICARYYELHLDEREKVDDNGKLKFVDHLLKALECAKKCCAIEPKYHKFHVNLGRIHALMRNNDEAEGEILKGISLVPNDSYHNATVSSFENYYENITSIVAYDKANGEIQKAQTAIADAKKELSSMRMENVRNVSVISAVFGLLMTGIKAFADLSDFKDISRVLIMYAGIFLFAISFVCFVTSLTSCKFRERILVNVLIIILAIVGITAFVLSLVL